MSASNKSVIRSCAPHGRSLRRGYGAAIHGVWEDNFQGYGARKVWRQLLREDHNVARCTVERLMREMGLRGGVRGGTTRTTRLADTDPRPLDLVEWRFSAERLTQLWIADFTYVAT